MSIYRKFTPQATTGLSIETPGGSSESVVLKDGAWFMTVGGYPSSTHYARLRYKLPEREAIVLTEFYMSAIVTLPTDFYDKQESGLRLINTDNYGTELGGTPVGTPGSAEFRTGVYIHADGTLRVRSDHDKVSVKDFAKLPKLPIGKHKLELYGNVSKDAPWYLKVDDVVVASGFNTLVADTVPKEEKEITRLVAGIDGASGQDSKTLSLYVSEFIIADYDAGDTELVEPMRCVKVVWRKGLNLRPTPSMYNTSYSGMNFGNGAEFPVEAIFDNTEGKWMRLNEKIYSAMWLKSNNTTYAIEVAYK
jgi:hypothetical protein